MLVSIVRQASVQTAGRNGPSTIERSYTRRSGARGVDGPKSVGEVAMWVEAVASDTVYDGRSAVLERCMRGQPNATHTFDAWDGCHRTWPGVLSRRVSSRRRCGHRAVPYSAAPRRT